MPIFKEKPSKNIVVNKKKTVTLDYKHDEILKNFKNDENNTIPKLKKEKQRLEKKLESLESKPNKQIDEILDLKDNITKIKKHIKSIKKKKKEYFLDNSKYVFDYFENKKSISGGQSKKVLLDDFFNMVKTNKKIEENNHNNVQKYLQNVDNSFLDINNFTMDNDVCLSCEDGELIPIDYEGVLVCNKCGKQNKCLIENEKPSYKEPPKEVCFYAYKRINHFREILAQFQAKETTMIPDDVIEKIKNQIVKERITIKQINNRKMKDILKKLGFNKYYEHIPFIKDKLGIRPPIMSPELETKLCNLFMDIQQPYAKFCPDDRVNFLNYYYTVYKLCELLEETQFLPFFPMLKDREKRIEQDDIWKKICRELNWEFIPTL